MLFFQCKTFNHLLYLLGAVHSFFPNLSPHLAPCLFSSVGELIATKSLVLSSDFASETSQGIESTKKNSKGAGIVSVVFTVDFPVLYVVQYLYMSE